MCSCHDQTDELNATHILLPSNGPAYDNVGDLGYILFGYRQSRIFRHIKYTALVTVCRMHERTRHGWYATE